jgi:hypothetical protein
MRLEEIKCRSREMPQSLLIVLAYKDVARAFAVSVVGDER